ncbi:MAG: hypothetical protein ACFCA4_00625 [Cyanophyceae cyanobacterium]
MPAVKGDQFPGNNVGDVAAITPPPAILRLVATRVLLANLQQI